MRTWTHDEALTSSKEYFNNDDLAAEVFVGKYALRNADSLLIENNPDMMHRRLAKEFARIEAKYPNPMSEEEIYLLLKDFSKLIPQGSPMSAIGNIFKLQSASNCFVIPPPKDSYGGIGYTDQQEAQIMKRRGGVGFDISTIRPKGLPTQNAAGTTDGIAVFMERFSNTCREVAQGGRRGALMLSISCHHPEIMTFINIKRDLKKITGANISVRWTDEFLEAVEKNERVQLRFPVEKDVKHTIEHMVDAKEVWDAFVVAAHSTGEPGCLFWDTALERTPADCYTDVGFGSTSTNPSIQADTLVLTKTGAKPIKWLAENEPTTFVRNIRGEWHPGQVFMSGQNKTLFEIKFTNNMNVKCTAEHRWPILNMSGNVFNIQTGKFLIKSTNMLKRGDKIYLPSFEKPIDNKDCLFNKMDGFVAGWNVGDGWKCWHTNNKVDQYGFIFSKEDMECGIGETILNYTNRLARRSSVIRQDHNCQAWTFVTTDLNVREQFNNFGIQNKKDGIPTCVWESNDEFIKGFIDGLFSSDGSIRITDELTSSYVVLISAHIKLVKDIQKLLGLYGISSSVNSYKAPSSFPNGKSGVYTRCELHIHGMQAAKFGKIFSLSNNKKQERLNRLMLLDTSKYVKERNYIVVKSVIQTEEVEDVYDITVDDDTHTFQTCTGITHNCGEIILSNHDSCRLLVINPLSYVNNAFLPNATFDFKSFKEDAIKAQRLMDDLIDLEIEAIDKIIAKVQNDPEPKEVKLIELELWQHIREAAVNGRRTGLGPTAIGDTVAALNLRYGSPASVAIVEEIYKAMTLGAYASSVQMAKERGTFPVWNKEKEINHPYLDQIWAADPQLAQEHAKFGRRNIALTTTAPTGSVSTMTQTSSGIEPVFMTHYKRRKKINPNDVSSRVDFIDPMGDKWQEYIVYHHGVEKWMKATGKINIEESPYHLATANDIDWEAGVELQAAAQRWICHAISRTTNLPNNATIKDVNDVYWKGWKTKCKGITVYRDGCRAGVLISADNNEVDKQKKSEERPKEITSVMAPKRPMELNCDIHNVNIRGVKWTVLVGLLGQDPYEIFVGYAENISLPSKCQSGKIVKIKRGHYDLHIEMGEDELIVKNIIKTFDNPDFAWATRLISISLRHGTPIDFIVEQLGKDGGLTDMNKVLARIFKKYIQEGQKVRTGTSCPQCGSDDMVYQEGCATCKSCGYSKCG